MGIFDDIVLIRTKMISVIEDKDYGFVQAPLLSNL